MTTASETTQTTPGPATARAGADRPSCAPADRVTKSLLGYGVLAGPLYLMVALAQALTRRGFHLAHHDASLLSNGDLGWIQVANFVLVGAMTIAAAVGVRRALGDGPARTAGPLLLSVYGLGLIAAGALRADPADGFPTGAPAGRSAGMSWHSVGHIIAGGVGFLALIAACLVLARHFAAGGRRGWARYSRTTGALFLLGFLAVTTGSTASPIVLGFWLAVLIAWAWLAAVAVHLYRRVGRAPAA
jgi:hypothetical protein